MGCNGSCAGGANGGTRLFSKLVLSSGGANNLSEVSQAVSMNGANAVIADIEVLSLSGTTPNIAVQLQESNDLENWRDKGAATNANAVGYSVLPNVTAIASAYVRLKLTLTGASPIAVVAAGVNTANI